MRIVGLVDSPRHVCARYRLEAFRPFLERAGHVLELVPWPTRWPSRIALDRRIRQAEVVLVQRRLLSIWQLFWLRRAARRLWFDFDDAVFLRDSYHPRGPHSRRLQRRFARLMASCERVLAGNSFLAEHAARWTDPDRVTLVPTCVDVARYPVKRATASERIELVWIGSASTMQGLDLVRDALERLAAHQPNLALRLVCDRTLQWKLPIFFSPWSEQTEAADLARADIGVSWIPDDDWSRGKCGLKILQYMAAGLPVVANAVGVHPEMIEHEKTGLLARTPEDWAAAIRRLARDAALRQRLGAAGRALVEKRYHLTTGAASWLELLKPTTSARQSA